MTTTFRLIDYIITSYIKHGMSSVDYARVTDVAVKHCNKHSCALYGGQPVRADNGYLPVILSTVHSGLVANSLIGGATCPWIIQVHKGQAINLTIINFNQQVRLLISKYVLRSMF